MCPLTNVHFSFAVGRELQSPFWWAGETILKLLAKNGEIVLNPVRRDNKIVETTLKLLVECLPLELLRWGRTFVRLGELVDACSSDCLTSGVNDRVIGCLDEAILKLIAEKLQKIVFRWTAFSSLFFHVALVFSLRAWYNKVVIPQPLHQQQCERDESMSNTKRDEVSSLWSSQSLWPSSYSPVSAKAKKPKMSLAIFLDKSFILFLILFRFCGMFTWS